MKEQMKKVSVANFNIVFLEKDDREAPLLEYFDNIIMPALNSNIQKASGEDKYIIMNSEIRESRNGEYVLTGYFVKKTVLERYSDLDSDGKLISLDDRYSAAPFSTFIIYLKNHRMIFIENQKGSPKLSSFRSTVKYILETFVKKHNEGLNDSSNEVLPIPLVNVIGIPSRKSMENELKDVEKISKLTLRFFPLNGDGDVEFSGVFSVLSKEFRKVLGSKTGLVQYNSPQNKQGVIEVLSAVEGTVEPIIEVIDKNNAKKTIRQDRISEHMKMSVSAQNLKEEMEGFIYEGSKLESIDYVSKENQDIYEKSKGKIIPFMKL